MGSDAAGGMRLRRPAALLALLAAGGAAIALILAGGSPSKPNPARDSRASGAATVERRDLVATDTEAGTLGYADPQTVYNRLSGTITWLPRVGQRVKPGGVLFRVDGRPVVLLDGTTPAYRDLAPGIGDGGDVLQLNRDLAALGFDPDAIAIDDEWQAATTAGIEQMQRSLGEPETGKLALGRVVFLPGTQVVTTVDATLGGDGSGSGSGKPSASNASDLGGGNTGGREYASVEAAATPPAKHRAPTAKGSARERRLEAQLARLEAEVSRLRSQGTPGSTNPPSSNGSGEPSETGAGGTTPTPILATTSTRIVVRVSLEASKQGEAHVGEAVTVALPDGQSVAGTVTVVSAVTQSPTGNSGAESGESPGSSSTVPVTIVLHRRRPGAGLDQAQVSVEFVRAVARNVLSVPVTALLATGPASYALQEASSRHRLIQVATGLFAAGDVQVSGAGVHPGLQVSDSQG